MKNNIELDKKKINNNEKDDDNKNEISDLNCN